MAIDDAKVRVFLGQLAGITSPVQMYADGLGAEIVLPAGGSVRLAVSALAEHGVLVDRGTVSLNTRQVDQHELAYCPPGHQDVVDAREVWQADISSDPDPTSGAFGPFGPFAADSAAPLPAPKLPNARLRSRP